MLEEQGISTVVVNQNMQQPERIKPPRALVVKYPFGQPFGLPGDVDQQRVIVEDALSLLATVDKPGSIVLSPYLWKRQDFAGVRASREKDPLLPPR